MSSISDITEHWKYDTRDLQQKIILFWLLRKCCKIQQSKPSEFSSVQSSGIGQWKNAKNLLFCFLPERSSNNTTAPPLCPADAPLPFQISYAIHQPRKSWPYLHTFSMADYYLACRKMLDVHDAKIICQAASSRKVLPQANWRCCRLAALLTAPSFPLPMLQARTCCRQATRTFLMNKT